MCFSINELRCERPYRYHLPISLGALGTSLDGAVGAALAGKPVVVLLGDSAFEETGGAEIATAVERKLPLVIVVLDDKGNGMVQQGFERLKGRFVPAMFGVGSNYGEIARARGAHARTASTRQELAVALSAALSARRPFLVHVVIRRDPGDPTPMGNRAAALATFSPPAADSDRDLARGTSRVQAKRR
jgi:thiamine pyrophosphate-dependent acetolactate synthase large subunit-like protein